MAQKRAFSAPDGFVVSVRRRHPRPSGDIDNRRTRARKTGEVAENPVARLEDQALRACRVIFEEQRVTEVGGVVVVRPCETRVVFFDFPLCLS